jgi:hypothetical protein
MSATPTLLSRNGRRSGTERGSENVNSLGKKDVGCAANGVVAETLDGGAEPHSPNLVEALIYPRHQSIPEKFTGRSLCPENIGEADVHVWK